MKLAISGVTVGQLASEPRSSCDNEIDMSNRITNLL